MAEAAERLPLLRLLAWLSPAFPVGSFSYSHGLETAAHRGLLRDGAGLRGWLEDLLTCGSAWNDAVLLAEAHRRAAAGLPLDGLAQDGEALAGSRERHMETMLQGEAFLGAAAAWPHPALAASPRRMPYPVAVGAVAGVHGIAPGDVLAAFLQAFVSSQTQAAIRLGVLGQTQAVATLAALEETVAAAAGRAVRSTLGDLGSATVMAEIVAMRHETQGARLFRT